jgi:hypothetical protein
VATLSGSQAYGWLAQSLAQEFAEVTFYEDLDTLLADRPDVIVLLDARSKLASVVVKISRPAWRHGFRWPTDLYRPCRRVARKQVEGSSWCVN